MHINLPYECCRVFEHLHYLVSWRGQTWAPQEECTPPCLCWTPAHVINSSAILCFWQMSRVRKLQKRVKCVKVYPWTERRWQEGHLWVKAPWRPPCNWSPRPPPGSFATSPAGHNDHGVKTWQNWWHDSTWQKSVKERDPVPSSILLIMSCTC